MKTFLGTFFACFVICCVFLFFGGFLIFENFWGMVAFVSLLMAVVISIFMHQETKLEELEKRLEALEAPSDKADTQEA